MRVECECGHQFEAPEDQETVECPRCGRQVETSAGDWVSSLDIGDLTLEGNQEEAAAPEEPQASGATPRDVAEKAAELELADTGDLELKETEAPEEAAEAQRTRPVRGIVPKSEGSVTEEKVRAPEGLLDLWRLLSGDPKNLIPHFRDGIKEPRLMLEAGILFLALAVLCGVAQASAVAQGVDIPQGILHVAGLVLEAAVAALMVGLLGYAFGKQTSPLGVGQGIGLVRVGSLLLLLPLFIGLTIVAFVAGGSESQLVGLLMTITQHLWLVYTGVVCLMQTVLIMGLLEMGCGGGFVISAVIAFAAQTLGTKVGAF